MREVGKVITKTEKQRVLMYGTGWFGRRRVLIVTLCSKHRILTSYEREGTVKGDPAFRRCRADRGICGGCAGWI